ncbi:MAG TPA: phosphoglycerate dehydrogenase [Kiritimatiellia bacterium]|nr:phosphoglycerate dehydrogenase [Kiritimatiellia bacterium]HRZ12315.1 phosphoglycerate dehydrogenase [Kiritimatiellia bacterium]HSA17927.1 phosphoglycerate dehydrogenase [Kiritimatiellia bacterium]
MKILIVDKFPDRYIAAIRTLGHDVAYEPGTRATDIAAKSGDADIIVVRSTEVTAETIQASKNLSLIIRAGAGTNNIDRKAASAAGVYVSNCPGTNSVAVAELAMGLICALDRRLVENVSDLRAGRWNKAEYSKAAGLLGKTLGVIGVGMIGKELIARARAFGLKVKAWSRSLTPEKAEALGVEYAASIAALVPTCDIISVHLAQAAETKGIISREVIATMKPGALFINTARAGVVDQAALVEAVKAKRIRVGTDVFEGEPEGKDGPFADELGMLPGVYGTHHIGASTEQAQDAVATETVRIIKVYGETGRVENWVNKMKKTPARFQLVVRHYDKPGVLADVLAAIREANVNAEEISNVIFDGAQAACCTIQLDSALDAGRLAKINALSGRVIHAAQVALA